MGLATTILNSRAANNAAETSADASDRAAALQSQTAADSIAETRRQFDTSRTDMQPWLTSGRSALGRIDAVSAGDMSGFFNSPDYNFRRTEGQRDIGNSFAARGGAASGNALRALSEFNQNLAAGSFGDWWNRTAAQAGVGQTAANQSAALGANAAGSITGINSNAASNIGNAWQTGANARASGIINAQNAMNQSNANTMQWAGRIFGWGA
jgi:hypothetical protein